LALSNANSSIFVNLPVASISIHYKGIFFIQFQWRLLVDYTVITVLIFEGIFVQIFLLILFTV